MDKDFFGSLSAQMNADVKEGLEARKKHPGPCTVEYMVLGYDKSRDFPSFLEALAWVAEREREGAQATIRYLLDDGSVLVATSATRSGAWCLTKAEQKEFGLETFSGLSSEDF